MAREGGMPAGEAENVEFPREEDGAAAFAVGSGGFEFAGGVRSG